MGEEKTVHIRGKRLNYSDIGQGTRRRILYEISPTADCTVLTLPILVIRGVSPGPRLSCVAGVHGNEHEGVTALLELWDELAPNEILRGTIVMIPSANPPAFRASARRNPDDLTDMNRAFPGRPDGNATEQIAYHLCTNILYESDLIVSMHGFTDDAMVVPYAEYPRDMITSERSLAAARAFGLEFVEAFDWPHGLLGAAMGRAGVPSIEPEIGGLGCTVPEHRALYKRGIYNLLRHLGMIQGEPQMARKLRQVTRATLFSSVGGVLRRYVELGDSVTVGARIATVSSLAGELLVALESPSDGFLGAVRMRASVNPGDMVAVVFQPLEN